MKLSRNTKEPLPISDSKEISTSVESLPDPDWEKAFQILAYSAATSMMLTSNEVNVWVQKIFDGGEPKAAKVFADHFNHYRSTSPMGKWVQSFMG